MPNVVKIVIGLEVHVQLLTKTKLFCGCLNQFGLPPNSATCPTCLGLPGSLPVMNAHAFQLALRAGLALNCQIASHPGQVGGFTKWDRKNYYYPDLPKNYQISQYELPFAHDGWLDIQTEKKSQSPVKRIRVLRAHLEEDAGKNLHDESGRGGDTRVDLNRTGTPLLEIVSHPDMNTPEEAVSYLEEIRLMMRDIGVSDCEMQEGSLRCDANVNLHFPELSEESGYAATPIVEIKNLNSFRSVGRAIKYEAERQVEQFHADPVNFRIVKIPKATAGWDDVRGRTEIQRHKEEAADYRYFPDPDLMPVIVTAEQIEAVRQEMGERPQEIRARLQLQYALSDYDAEVLVAKGRKMVAYFETVTREVGDAKTAANRLSDLVYPRLSTVEIDAFAISASSFADFVKKTAALTKQDRIDLFAYMLEHDVDIEQAMAATGLAPKQFDEELLRVKVREAIQANPKAVADFKKGKEAAKMSIVGMVMKGNKGVPNELVRKLVDDELSKQ